MYLLKRNPTKRFVYADKFTFHHVSIKTISDTFELFFTYNLHSTMYLLKHTLIDEGVKGIINLHSTMYLLKLTSQNMVSIGNMNLHSTMYLLKRFALRALSPA